MTKIVPLYNNGEYLGQIEVSLNRNNKDLFMSLHKAPDPKNGQEMDILYMHEYGYCTIVNADTVQILKHTLC